MQHYIPPQLNLNVVQPPLYIQKSAAIENGRPKFKTKEEIKKSLEKYRKQQNAQRYHKQRPHKVKKTPKLPPMEVINDIVKEENASKDRLSSVWQYSLWEVVKKGQDLLNVLQDKIQWNKTEDTQVLPSDVFDEGAFADLSGEVVDVSGYEETPNEEVAVKSSQVDVCSLYEYRMEEGSETPVKTKLGDIPCPEKEREEICERTIRTRQSGTNIVVDNKITEPCNNGVIF
jgi:hypothetical protein